MPSYLAKLQAAKAIADVAALLGFKTTALAYILYSKSAPAKFQTFQIPKKSGGTRTIEAPNAMLKTLQRRLADLLQNCEAEVREQHGRHDAGPKPDLVSRGFVRGRSIFTNAKQHRRRRMVLNIDLEDFFPSINFGRVRGFFIRDKNFRLHPSVATILAQIASSNNHLPQGSPCSPVVANLIGHILDVQLVRLAARCGCRYTRYADDLTFSTNKKDFPLAIAAKVEGERQQWTVARELSDLVKSRGFRINASKTRMQYRDSRQVVTGLVVNKRISVPSDYRHTVRAMTHRLFTTGAFEIGKTVASATGSELSKVVGDIKQLHGMIGFIDKVDLDDRKCADDRSRRQSDKVRTPSSRETLYRNFLLFKDFYTADRPVLVCEGKTDNVYITHAIRAMAARFPRLAAIEPSKKVTLKLRRYRYTNATVGRILGIAGGHGDLQKLLFTYRDALKAFKAPRGANPVIILIDNDSAAKPMISALKKITSTEPSRSAPFIHAYSNLYVIFTPLPPGVETSTIEDLFDSSTRAVKLNGKSFNPLNEYVKGEHYGKVDFAYKVVQPRAETIDFGGFTQLLESISAAIEDYERRIAS